MIQTETPDFGTSGLRGLVAQLTPELVADHIRAFLAACDSGTGICLGWDLRPSSPTIAKAITAAVRAEGVDLITCGAVPTPALALAAQARGAAAIMITGSHIPADRNGLKFYTRRGEISKDEETAIKAALGRAPAGKTAASIKDTEAGAAFVARYVQACGTTALRGKRIGLYSHSAVGRDLLAQILRGLGAEVIELGRSDQFIPVDTEAVAPEVRAHIRDWVKTHALDALVSTDGDSDRPLMADERGQIVPGDILGQITAQTLGAQKVVTPISSNSGVTQKTFETVTRTRIGSPYVIAGMAAAHGAVVGYEANGGFLLGFEAQGPAGGLTPLRTRDCMLPLVMTLIAAGDRPLSERVAEEPPVFTVADRLQQVPQALSQTFVQKLTQQPKARAAFLAALGQVETHLDLTDGLRMGLQGGGVIHLRPSGNAPELRLYIEAADKDQAQILLVEGVAQLRHAVQVLAANGV